NHLWRRHMPSTTQRWGQDGPGRFLGIGITFFVFSMLLVLFRASTFHAASEIYTALVGLHGFDWSSLPQYYPSYSGIYSQVKGFGIPWSETTVVVGFIVCCFAIIWLFPNSQQIMGYYEPGLNTFKKG